MGSVEPFKAPTVEPLSVRVVVDSVFDQFMPKATHPIVTIEHVGRIRNNLNSTLAGESGLSLHLESRNAGATGNASSTSAARPRYGCGISGCSPLSPSGS